MAATLVGVLGLLPWILPSTGRAQQREQTEAISVAEAVKRLKSANRDEVRLAIQLLAVSNSPQAAQPIVEFLRAGPADVLTNDAIVALGGSGNPVAVEPLIDFLHHRRVDVRVRAIEALSNIRDPRVAAVIENALRDPETRVRGTAALALGRIGARGAVDTLFRAFDRNVPEAAQSIGQLGDADAAERFSRYLRQRPLREILPGLREFLKRRDLPEPPKVMIVNKLLDVSGIEVKRFLMEIEDSVVLPVQSPLRRAIDEAIRRIPGVVTLEEGAGPATPAAAPTPAPAPATRTAAPAAPAAPAPAAGNR